MTGTEDIRDEIGSRLLSGSLAEFVSEYILERLPLIFSDDWGLYRAWRRRLARGLGVDPCEICVTGSACVGCSLNPNKNLSYFSEESDVDVAIVSEYHFNEAWHFLRGFSFGTHYLTPGEKQSIIDHQKQYIYWGCVATDRILRLLPFAKPWTIALSEISAVEPTFGRTVNLRIYKDFDALRGYQLTGVEKLRTELLSGG